MSRRWRRAFWGIHHITAIGIGRTRFGLAASFTQCPGVQPGRARARPIWGLSQVMAESQRVTGR